MTKASISSAGSFGIQFVRAKPNSPPTRQSLRPANRVDDRDDEADEQAAPPPGMGKLVDRQA
jgi:hypothetical protein